MSSAIVKRQNILLQKCQNSKLALFVRDSLLFQNIDNLIAVLIFCLLIFSVFLNNEISGLVSYFVIFLALLKLLFKKGETLTFNKIDIFVIFYFLFVFISLCGSTLLNQSFHGFLKTFTYIAFYFSICPFFKNNKDKILPIIVVVSLLASFEAIYGIFQNYFGVMEISGWQDTTNLDVNEVLSRCYGTLKPYNPNLFAGYLVASVSSVFCLLGFSYLKKNKFFTSFFGVLFALISLAIFYSGSRGAYIGLLFIYIAIFVLLYKRFYLKYKKEFKIYVSSFLCMMTIFVLSTPSILKRILSIFTLREDSSTSFRMNVYKASFDMFRDNLFLGIGVGNKNFREIYGLYMKTGFDALGSYCMFLEIAVESGIFALLSFLTFLYFSIKKCFDVFKSDKSDNLKLIAFSIFLMILGIIGHGFFDTIWFRPQVQFLFWIYIAILNNV